MLNEHIADIFHRHIDLTMQSIEVLTPSIVDASERMVACMLAEGKILCCGEGANAIQAQHLSSNLLNRYLYERPSLPALNLCADASLISAISSDNNYVDVFAKQIQALGQPGDLLFLCFQGSGSVSVVKAVQAAHERDMGIIALCNLDGSDVRSLLTSQDLEICVSHNHRARVMELQLLVVNSLCELIDMQLFGAEV